MLRGGGGVRVSHIQKLNVSSSLKPRKLKFKCVQLDFHLYSD